MNISTVFALFVEIYARLSQYFAQNRPIVALNIVRVVLGADTQLVAAVVVTHDANPPKPSVQDTFRFPFYRKR